MHYWGSGGEPPNHRGLRRLGAMPPAANEFLRFSHKKNTHFSTLFIEKGHAVSAVALDNTNMLSPLMSKKQKLG